MCGKSLAALFLILISASFGLGQKNETETKQGEKKCQPSLTISEQLADSPEMPQSTDSVSARATLLRSLLPSSENAWVVQIVTTGGFSGQGLPTLTVTSNGDLYIADQDSLINRADLSPTKKVGADVLQKITQIVYADNPSGKNTETIKDAAEATNTAQKEISFLCSDCYQTSITVVRKQPNGEAGFFTNRQKNIHFSTGDYNRIHRIITQHADSPN